MYKQPGDAVAFLREVLRDIGNKREEALDAAQHHGESSNKGHAQLWSKRAELLGRAESVLRGFMKSEGL
jgi:hypothetical protein